MTDLSEVCVCIPTLNESETIGAVIDDFQAEGVDEILVIDGKSTDETRAIAEEHGATVITQTGAGKGNAVKEAIDYIDQPYIVLVDGDQTYHARDVHELVAPLKDGTADHVIANRFANIKDGALSPLNHLGNRLINYTFRLVHGEYYKDILSGYRAFTRESVERYSLTADGFGIETELAVECARRGERVKIIPTTYSPRPGGSTTNLHPFRDGVRIMFTLYWMSRTSNPLFYFGSLGVTATATGGGLAGYVAWDWVNNSTSHEVLAVVAASGILLGVQLLAFALLADMITSLHTDLRQQLDNADRLD